MDKEPTRTSASWINREPTRASASWISRVAIIGGLATAVFQLFAVLTLGPSAVSVVALATSAALIIIGAWARQIARRLPS